MKTLHFGYGNIAEVLSPANHLLFYFTVTGYRTHTDCTEDGDIRDRFATVLVYLQDVKEGGETKFPLLGISVKPVKGRLLVWNNMRPDGTCDPTSIHNAAKVINGRKFIIQRW